MKKRLLAIFLAAVLLFPGCGKSGSGKTRNSTWKPEEVSNDIRPYVERAIEIIDSYLDFDISAEEADAAFAELRDRLEGLNVTEADSEYSQTDITAAYRILLLSYQNSKYHTDSDFRFQRDLLSFQIGQNVSGQSYPIENCREILQRGDFPNNMLHFNAPVLEAFFHAIDTESCMINLTFDAVNGVHPSSLTSYAQNLIDIVSQQNIRNVTIFINYDYYEQPVFWLRLFITEEGITGHIANNTKADDVSYATIDSAEGIEKAIAKGTKFLGQRSIPNS